MRNDALREYKFKLYLNANHFVIFNGEKGESHPHTWEFVIEVLVDKDKFIKFLDFEKAIDEYLEPYQDKLINDIEPFDHEFIRKAVHTAETAVFETGIPLPNPIDPNARVCFPPDAPPSQETIERIRQGDHGLDNKVWALVLSSPE